VNQNNHGLAVNKQWKATLLKALSLLAFQLIVSNIATLKLKVTGCGPKG